MEAAGGSCLPETVDILKPHRVSPKPRQTVSLNVRLVRGRRSLWKNGNAAAFSGVLFFFVPLLYLFREVPLSAYNHSKSLWRVSLEYKKSSFLLCLALFR